MKTCYCCLISLVISITTRSQNPYEVIITEIMADPSPVVGLPNSEWIELKNLTSGPINLQGFRLGDANSLSGPFPNFLLQPDSFLIICSSSAIASLSLSGTAIAITSFPSLDNDGDLIYLRNSGGKTIHAVKYSSKWYQNALKKEGGWTLEMIDQACACLQSENWKASTDISGGTPGRKNSVNGIVGDDNPPRLIKGWPLDSISVILEFDEPVDSTISSLVSCYSVDGGPGVLASTPLPPLFNTTRLLLASPLSGGKIYRVTVSGLRDCRGNLIGQFNLCRVGLPEDPAAGDWIINEILFDPRPAGYDYVEFYNNSGKIFDASKLYIANRNSAGDVANIRQLSAYRHLVFPGDHIVITEEAENLSMQYLVRYPEHILTVPSLPSFPDDEGIVIAMDFNGTIVDEVHYKDDWHYKLITDAEGIALERVDPLAESNKPGNWHSAASTAGFGTPTYKNSQSLELAGVEASFGISPVVISPDNDGYHDIATINYRLTEPGYTANITIFDLNARVVRLLARNAILGTEGYFTWDGLDENDNKLNAGIYVIYTEIFNLQGKKKIFKNKIVLAYKF